MKEFWLGILKNIITYVAMIVIVIVGGLSISTQKFPPNWNEVVSAVNTLKNGYVSMLNLRQQMGGMAQMQQGLGAQIPDVAALEGDSATPTGPLSKKDADLQMTLALVQSMGQQIAQKQQLGQVNGNANPNGQNQALNPEFKKYLDTIKKQNEDMIDRMDKIHVYLAGLHQYLAETRRQPSAVAQQVHPVQSAAPHAQNAVAPVSPAPTAALVPALSTANVARPAAVVAPPTATQQPPNAKK